MPIVFSNILLLGGIAAVSIPIMIHLFNRSRYRVVKWGAMHLLESVVRVNRKRVRIEQLILLLLRCAIPVILAIMMAQPVVTNWTALSGNAKSGNVILLDNSYSMEAKTAGNSHFKKAVDSSSQIIKQLKRGSEVSVITMAGGVAPLTHDPSFDLKGMVTELDKMRAGFGSVDTLEALETGLSTTAAMTPGKRDLILISDFQRTNWTADKDAAIERVKELTKGMAIKPSLTFFKVGQEIKENIAVEEITFSRNVIGINQPIKIRATIRNYGESDMNQFPVYFRVDGEDIKLVETSVAKGEHQQVMFTHTFETPGSHVVEIFAKGTDELKADNSLQAAVPVWEKIPVLLVDGDPSDEPLQGETDFLDVALQPFSSSQGKLEDLLQTEVVKTKDLDPKTMNSFRLIVLANVDRLNDTQLKAVTQFVQDGGGLLVFPGNKIDLGWYNTVLGSSKYNLLPMKYSAISGDLKDESKQTRILSGHYDHPALTLFNDRRNGELSDTRMMMWYKMLPKQGEGRNLDVMTMLESGDACFVETKVGQGRVIQSAIPCDTDWTNLPMRPFFVPLMQQIATHLSSTVYPPRNVAVGQGLIAFTDAPTGNSDAILTDPTGAKHQVKVRKRGERGVIEYNDAKIPGKYIVALPNKEQIHFVVNTTRTESALGQLSTEEIKEIAKGMNADYVTSWDEYHELDSTRRFGREIWRWMLMGLLGVIFLELFLEQWFARRAS